MMVEEDKQLIKYLISPVRHYLEAMLLLKLPGAFHKGAATFDFLQNDFDHNDPKETKKRSLGWESMKSRQQEPLDSELLH